MNPAGAFDESSRHVRPRLDASNGILAARPPAANAVVEAPYRGENEDGYDGASLNLAEYQHRREMQHGSY
jgi:hypothetical protein